MRKAHGRGLSCASLREYGLPCLYGTVIRHLSLLGDESFVATVGKGFDVATAHFEQVATRELQAKSRKDMRTAVSEKVSGEGDDTGGGGGDDQTE